MTETLTLDQAFHTLEEKLETSGVQETTARRYAQEFVEELQAGRSLSFADVGELRWQGDHVVLVKDLDSHQAVTERQPFRDVSASESSEPSEALTVRRRRGSGSPPGARALGVKHGEGFGGSTSGVGRPPGRG